MLFSVKKYIIKEEKKQKTFKCKFSKKKYPTLNNNEKMKQPNFKNLYKYL